MALIVRRPQDPFRPLVAVTHPGPISCPKGRGHLLLAMSAALMTFTGSASAARDRSPVEHGILPTKDLSAFEDTCWYVPADYLLAYRYKDQPESAVKAVVEAVVDQTLWHLTKARKGYLLGCSYRTIDGGGNWSVSTIVGSVAPNDKVLMGFNSGTVIDSAPGTLISSHGRSVFLMQVAGTPPESSLTHWAYMVQVTPSDAAWNALPGTNGMSVESVLSVEPEGVGCVVDP